MTAMKSILDALVYANVILALAFCVWSGCYALMRRSALRNDYGRQLVVAKAVLIITILSPVIAHFGAGLGQTLFPRTPTTLSDIAVAAYLRGDITIPAIQFEALLNSRSQMFDTFLKSDAVWVMATKVLFTCLFVFFAARMVWALLRVKHALDGSFLWRRTKHVDIRVSDTVSIPFAARGLLRRYVVLPSSLMTHPKELRLVLAHEFQHLRAGDVEWELAVELVRPLLFWNPAFVLWKRTFDHLRELSCDQAVIAQKRVSPHDYARCLLDFCERRLAGHWPRAMNVALVRSDHTTSRRLFENRIRAMYTRPTGGGRCCMVSLVAVMGICVTLGATSLRHPADWSHDRLMLSTIVNLERLEAINRR